MAWFFLVALLCGQPVFAQAETAAVLPLAKFLQGAQALERYVSDRSRAYDSAINDALARDAQEEALGMVLDEGNLISKGLAQIERARVVPEGERLKTQMIRYYRAMMSVNAARVKFLVGAPGSAELLEQATKDRAAREASFLAELTSAKKARAARGASAEVAAPEARPLPLVSPQLVNQLEQENARLAEETRELVELNRALELQTRALIEENKRMRVEVISRSDRPAPQARRTDVKPEEKSLDSVQRPSLSTYLDRM